MQGIDTVTLGFLAAGAIAALVNIVAHVIDNRAVEWFTSVGAFIFAGLAVAFTAEFPHKYQLSQGLLILGAAQAISLNDALPISLLFKGAGFSYLGWGLLRLANTDSLAFSGAIGVIVISSAIVALSWPRASGARFLILGLATAVSVAVAAAGATLYPFVALSALLLYAWILADIWGRYIGELPRSAAVIAAIGAHTGGIGLVAAIAAT